MVEEEREKAPDVTIDFRGSGTKQLQPLPLSPTVEGVGRR